MSYVAAVSYGARRQWTEVPVQAIGRELVLSRPAFILAILALQLRSGVTAQRQAIRPAGLRGRVHAWLPPGSAGSRLARGWPTGRSTLGGAASPLLLATLMMSECIYALAGAGVRRLVSPGQLSFVPGRWNLILAAAALVTTPGLRRRDQRLHGIVWAQMTGAFEYKRWIMIALFNPGALLFAAYHAGSNILFFGCWAAGLRSSRAPTGAKKALPWEA